MSEHTSLTDEERAVYQWQLWVAGFGEAGQLRLKNASVLVSRCGGVGGTVALHLAAARGDNEVINYLVKHGADVMAVNRAGQTTVDMANSPEQRTQPFPDTIKLLEGMGAKNNHKCAACKASGGGH